ANVLIWKAIGPHEGKNIMPPKFFKLMGMDVPAENGEYFVDLSRYLKDHLKIEDLEKIQQVDDQLNRATQRPWIANEYPNLASWLKSNERPLALIVEATKRLQYFSPLVPGKTDKGSSGLISAHISGEQKNRALANALAARGLLKL